MTRARPGHRFFGVLLALGLTVAALYLVFRGIDSRHLWNALAQQDGRLLLVAAVLILLQIVCGGERWRTILGAIGGTRPPPASSVHAAFYSSIFFNYFPLGSVGGDIARVWLARKFNRSTGQVIMSVLVDHATALIGMILLAVVTLPAVSHPWAKAAWLAACALLLMVVLGLYLLGLVEQALGRWQDRRIVFLVLRVAEELQRLTRHRRALVALLYALLSSVCSGLSAYCIALSLHIAISTIAMLAVMSLVMLVTVLPISIAGWGVREVSVVTLLGMLGVSQEPALLLSLEIGLLTLLISLPGGSLWLIIRKEEDKANLEWKS